MPDKKFFSKKLWLIISAVILLMVVWVLYAFKYAANYPSPITLTAPDNFWGVTYSKRFASSLGLSWREAYLALLDDLQVKNIRLPLYWNDLEPANSQFIFDDYDWLISEGAKRQVKFILVIGRRLPRWPECHQPEWTAHYGDQAVKQKILLLLQTIVERYQNNPAVVAWQVENEPFLNSFGLCPRADGEFLKQEVAAVKALDSRPILMTASGELSSWQREARLSAYFGTTLYRVVWGPLSGYWRYPLPVWFYQSKLRWAGLTPNQTVIAELQAEPWAPNTSLDKLPPREAAKSFSLEQMRANLQYAIDTGFSQAYLWGAEWWYMEKQRGNPQFWDEAKKLNW